MDHQTTINLSPDLQEFIEARLASGQYQSAADVVREAFRLLEEQESDHQVSLSEARQKIAVGLEEARRGELLDGEDVFREPHGARMDKAPARQSLGAIFRRLGIDDVKPIGAEKLQEMMLQDGIRPEDNILSRGIIEMREE